MTQPGNSGASLRLQSLDCPCWESPVASVPQEEAEGHRAPPALTRCPRKERQVLEASPALPSCASLLLLGRLPAATRESTRAERKEGPVGAWGLCTPADPGGDAPHP